MPPKNAFQGQIALLTGASSGIGRALAFGFAQAGASLYLLARDNERLNTLCSELQHEKHHANQFFQPILCDLRDCENITSRIDSTLGTNPLDLLINNAGISVSRLFEHTTPAEIQELYLVNALAPVLLTQRCLPNLRSGRAKKIAFTSSVAGYIGVFGYAAYAATKFSLRGLVESLEYELTPEGFRISLIFPPDTDTPQWQREELTKPQTTKDLSFTPLLSPELVAEKTVAGILNNKRYIFPCWKSRALFYANQYFPGLVRSFANFQISQSQSKRRLR